MQKEFDKIQAGMGRPIPGQSLTSNPDTPAPYEQAPMFTTVDEASKYLWDFVTDEPRYVAIMRAVDEEIPVMELVRVILFNHFVKGAFNPDLMLMMAEPLAFMIIALAERLDLDIKITDDDDDDEEEEMFGTKLETQKLDQLRASAKSSKLPQGFITQEMEEEIRNLPDVSSLLAPQAEAVDEGPVEKVSLDQEANTTQESSMLSPQPDLPPQQPTEQEV
jgi:hypothetical protein